MTTLTVFADIADNVITSSSSTYSSAANTGGSLALQTVTQTFETIGQDNTFAVSEYFVSFNTSSIGATSLVTAVTFSLVGFSDNSTVDFDMQCRLKDWGTAVDTGDWVAGNVFGTLLASFNTASFSQSSYMNFTENGTNFQTNITKAGSTRFLVASSRQASNTTPTSSGETVGIIAADAAGTTSDPKLVVTYTLVPGSPFGLFAYAQQPSGITNVALAWIAPTSGGSPTGYLIERAPDAGGSAGAYVQIIDTASTALSSVDTDVALAYSTTYWYRIRAYNAAGNGPYATDITTHAATPPLGGIWLKQYIAPGFFTGANPSIIFNNSLTTGSLIVICLRDLEPTSANIVDPTGFTRRASKLAANINAVMVDRVTQGGDSATISFTDATSISYEIVGLEFINAATVNEFDSASAGTDNSGSNVTTIQPGSLTPSRVGELLVTFTAQPSGSPGSFGTIDSGFVNLYPVSSENRSICAYKIKTDTTAENPTFTWTTSSTVMAIMAAFNPLAVPAYFGLSVGLSKAAGRSVSAAAVQF